MTARRYQLWCDGLCPACGLEIAADDNGVEPGYIGLAIRICGRCVAVVGEESRLATALVLAIVHKDDTPVGNWMASAARFVATVGAAGAAVDSPFWGRLVEAVRTGRGDQ